MYLGNPASLSLRERCDVGEADDVLSFCVFYQRPKGTVHRDQVATNTPNDPQLGQFGSHWRSYSATFYPVVLKLTHVRVPFSPCCDLLVLDLWSTFIIIIIIQGSRKGVMHKNQEAGR